MSTIVGTYKAAVTRRCRKEHRSNFAWQSRFYEHVVRGPRDLQRVRRYIRDNPARWYRNRLR